jgi:simple sugar transport system ATP-binding protein
MSEAVQPILEVNNLSKHFGAVRALSDFSMVVRPGEVVALAGDNGAGKTTLIKAISGVYRPSSGDVILRGEHVSFSTPQEARDKGIETIYQDLALADNLSIGANIFLGREPMRKAFGFLPVLDRKKMADAARQTMALLDFHVSRMEAPVSNFSGGQRQAVAIGRAVYWNAQILIMDEPTAALGVPEQRKVISLIHQLKAQGRGVIFISHNLQDIFAVSDRIIVLRRGVTAGERKISETTHDEVVKLMVGG